jgi:hypothetical protein
MKLLGNIIESEFKQFRFTRFGRNPVPVESAETPVILGFDISPDSGEGAFCLGRITVYPRMNEYVQGVYSFAEIEAVPDIGDSFTAFV